MLGEETYDNNNNLPITMQDAWMKGVLVDIAIAETLQSFDRQQERLVSFSLWAMSSAKEQR